MITWKISMSDVVGSCERAQIIFSPCHMMVAAGLMTAKATARVSAVELKGFKSVQTDAKIQLANASLTGIVGPNGNSVSPGTHLTTTYSGKAW